jgi:hypothetical protein
MSKPVMSRPREIREVWTANEMDAGTGLCSIRGGAGRNQRVDLA